MNLVHLVSEQTLQNLIPLLALRPSAVIQIRSSEPRFQRAAENLKRAVESIATTQSYAGYCPEFIEQVIDDPMPSIDATRRKVGEALSLWPGAIVNLTGGTKLMSIGAWQAAEYQHEPILYCDTGQRRFVIEGARQPANLASFDAVAAGLTVESVLAAAGLDPAQFHFEKTPAAHSTFAAAAGRVATAWQLWIATESERFYDPQTKNVLAKGKIRCALEKPVRLPPDNLLPATKAAVAAGALREASGELFLAPDPATFNGNNDRLRRAAEDNLRLLRGGWFEIVVESALARSGRFANVRRGLATDRDTAFGETDFVAFDSRSVCLVVVSCKTGDQHLRPLEHLSELRDRAHRLGGTFARSALVLGQSHNASRLSDIVAFARALGIAVYFGNPAEGSPRLAATDLPDHLRWLPPRP